MNNQEAQKAILVLEDGTCFQGKLLGQSGTTFGEICFNTTMTGYQEVFTDPSYFGQIVTMTTSHIGNYGVHEQDVESDQVMIKGLVCNDFSDQYFSRPRSTQNLNAYFQEQGVTGVKHIDTRALVRHIRHKGAMNAVISSEEFDQEKLLQRIKNEAPKMNGLELSSKVTTKTAYCYGEEKASYKISVLDLGVKKNILRCLSERGAYLKVFPLHATKDDLMSFNPDGIMLSNGPGDPSAMKATIKLVQDLLQTNIPMFGICLGHQILALSQGLTTYKMHNGHRGVNHPVQNLITGKSEVTSQNHGFVVSEKEVQSNENVELTHRHLNDQTVAGIKLKDRPAFSVQFHPESSAGPNDSRYLFDEFINQIKKHKK